MGGVDRHDQLRLQRYALQTSFRCKKYYKSFFLGIVDLVIVNAYVTHIKCAKDLGNKPMTRAAFMTEVHEQLIKQSATDFLSDEQATPTNGGGVIRHTIEQHDEWRIVGKQGMRRRNACKVCSLKFRKKGRKSNESSWYCVRCSEDNKRLFLCNTIRAAQGNKKTCFDIWHQDWRCKKPANATTSIQMRPTTGERKRKRVRRTLLQETKVNGSDDEGDYEEEEQEDEEQGQEEQEEEQEIMEE